MFHAAPQPFDKACPELAEGMLFNARSHPSMLMTIPFSIRTLVKRAGKLAGLIAVKDVWDAVVFVISVANNPQKIRRP